MADGTEIATNSTDPLIGGTVQISGNYAGIDLLGLSDITWSPSTIQLLAAGAPDQVTITGTLSAAPEYRRLDGPLANFPYAFRPMTTTIPATATRVGGGSQGIAAFALRVPFNPLTVEIQISPGGPILRSLRLPLRLPAVGDTDFSWMSDGMGGCSVGIVNAFPMTQFFNFVEVAPAAPVGAGPFFGLGFGPSQLAQLTLPLGVHPLHAQVDAAGVYFWGAPAGTIPAGLTVDVALVELPPNGSVFPRPVVRLTF